MTSPPPLAVGPSSAPRTLGVLCIVFGAVVGLSELGDLLGAGVTQDRSTMDLLGGVGVEIAAVGPYLALRALVMLAMSIGLVVVGIGLRKQREPFRVAAVIWCEVAFAAIVGRAVLWEAVVWPHLDRARRITEGGFDATGLSVVGLFVSPFLELGRITEYIALAVLLPFPVVLVTILSRRRLRARMQA